MKKKFVMVLILCALLLVGCDNDVPSCTVKEVTALCVSRKYTLHNMIVIDGVKQDAGELYETQFEAGGRLYTFNDKETYSKFLVGEKVKGYELLINSSSYKLTFKETEE